MSLSDSSRTVFNKLYERHYDNMYFSAKRILGDSLGEDAVHEVFLKLISRYEKNCEALLGKPARFFLATVKNHCINQTKSNRIEFHDEMEPYSEVQADIAEKVADNDACNQLVAYIRQMPEESRQILEYKYIQEYSNKEIAIALGISEVSVAVKLKRARDRLRKLIQKGGIEIHGA
jgi:RNA polymerase sigma-70 factor (ECF subfamily)